ncbi:hypothetical protein [Actibacterium sp. 188UL27-1]|uniref:hypothetical protein n=1 Tax=Actibacterium sp. 188UL27-1 TaxID=2786961 RepID=UPI00195C956A|nr:hypothetical protein [Actibacterium sp. 188UL27-1]MBM7065967.1 hypothetical protein [Actibacterium sp. 188UL27-1]
MQRFSRDTFARIEDRAADQWDTATAIFLKQQFPDHISAMGAETDDLKRLSQTVRQDLSRYNIAADQSVRRLCIVALTLGTFFTVDPRFVPDITYALDKYWRPEQDRVSTAVAATHEWAAYAWAEDGLPAFGIRLADLIQADAPLRDPYPSHPALPGQSRLITAQLDQTFFETCGTESARHGIDAHWQRRAHAYIACAHGARWLDDPQFPRLHRAFAAATTRDDLATALNTYYGGFA